jgi:hypothetical protein
MVEQMAGSRVMKMVQQMVALQERNSVHVSVVPKVKQMD